MAVLVQVTSLSKLFLWRALVAELNKMPPVVTGPVSPDNIKKGSPETEKKQSEKI